MEKRNYLNYLLMLGLSFLTMYSVMYANVDDTSHIYFSINRFYMTILMVAPMAIIMMIFMRHMYKNKKLNGIIIALSTVIFITIYILLRNQNFVDDRGFMESMIPHHSSAILVSKEAQIKDPEVVKLAHQIIKSQEEEIAQMKNILKRMAE